MSNDCRLFSVLIQVLYCYGNTSQFHNMEPLLGELHHRIAYLLVNESLCADNTSSSGNVSVSGLEPDTSLDVSELSTLVWSLGRLQRRRSRNLAKRSQFNPNIHSTDIEAMVAKTIHVATAAGRALYCRTFTHVNIRILVTTSAADFHSFNATFTCIHRCM